MINFKSRHFIKNIILMAVRWYISYSLSYRDIEELMLERGMSVDHSTLNLGVIYYSPLLEEEFSRNKKRKTGSSWRMDETYIKLKGEWTYYRAVNKEGDTIDFMLSKKRDEASARAFFTKAIDSSGIPGKITIDKSGANKAGIEAINLQLIVCYLVKCSVMQINIRQIKHLNNIIEQDHRGIKRITKPMMGFKAFHAAQATLAGIELYRMVKKGQHVDAKNGAAFEQFYALAA